MQVFIDVTAKIYEAWKEKEKVERERYGRGDDIFHNGISDHQKCMGLECGIVWMAKSCGKCTENLFCHSIVTIFVSRTCTHRVHITHISYG